MTWCTRPEDTSWFETSLKDPITRGIWELQGSLAQRTWIYGSNVCLNWKLRYLHMKLAMRKNLNQSGTFNVFGAPFRKIPPYTPDRENSCFFNNLENHSRWPNFSVQTLRLPQKHPYSDSFRIYSKHQRHFYSTFLIY